RQEQEYRARPGHFRPGGPHYVPFATLARHVAPEGRRPPQSAKGPPRDCRAGLRNWIGRGFASAFALFLTAHIGTGRGTDRAAYNGARRKARARDGRRCKTHGGTDGAA